MIENSPTVGVSQSTNQQPVLSTSTNHTRPEYTANKDRIAAQKSSENYKEIGSEFKYLLNEMKIFISDRQETDTPPSQSRRRNKENRPALDPHKSHLLTIEGGLSHILEDPSPPPQLQPDTQAICRRLEERIAKLTTMGGNLQKENKEMADLMKTQGKKLKKVKENEKRISKTRR